MFRSLLKPFPWLALAMAVCLGLALATPAQAIKDANLDTEALGQITKPSKVDFDQMLKDRLIRALVVYSKTNYFLDGAKQRGLVYEILKQFEEQVNKTAAKKGKKKRHLKVHIVMIPVSRDQLLPYLAQGRGDIAVANLTVTPQRKKLVDFSIPMGKNVKELVVTSAKAPAINKVEDLAGKRVYVRKSSSYYESLVKLNRKFKKKGLKPINIQAANENLETEDILEMVNANLIPITIADGYLANFWAKIFKGIKVHKEIYIKSGVEIAWAVRKNCPKLLKAVNKFVKTHRAGTKIGNILINRYLKNTRWAKNALSPESIKAFNQTVKLFEKYSGKYRFDYLMVTALAYQESGLDQRKRSPAGAIGIMQLLKSTAAGDPINIPQIEKLEHNIHAGVKYLRHVYDQYYADTKMTQLNKVLFTFASYNAGPSRVNGMRRRAKKMGLDPNIWFRNVEVVAARVIGRETVQYVSNIFKYYLAYQQLVGQQQEKEKAAKALGKKK